MHRITALTGSTLDTGLGLLPEHWWRRGHCVCYRKSLHLQVNACMLHTFLVRSESTIRRYPLSQILPNAKICYYKSCQRSFTRSTSPIKIKNVSVPLPKIH